MWFGTKDGLNRYDGYHFTIFRHDPYDSTPISGHEIKVLYEDKAVYLWIGTTGLNRFDPRTETFVRYLHDPANPNNLSHNDVLAIAEDTRLDGTLWIGTAKGLNRLGPNREGDFIRYLRDPDNPQSLSNDHVRALLVDRTGMLWVGTTNGLNTLPTGSTNGFIRYQLKEDEVISLYEDSHGALWIGTPSGLFRLDRNKGWLERFRHYPYPSETFV
jgi:ligand-binding sensor domain-containing protein